MASYICRQCRVKTASVPLFVRTISSSAARFADDPASSLADTISRAPASRSPTNSRPSRLPSEPFDSSNPSHFPTGNKPPSDANSQTARQRPSPGNLIGALRQSFNAAHRRPNSNDSEYQQQREASKALIARRSAIEQQQSRIWREGDVYAPHDLSPVEQMKARAARASGRARDMRPLNTRKGGGKDVLDDLAIDPLKEYKNFAMMSEFTTDMGRIRHGRDTGFRAVNQRKMAKAVRRARGLGLLPSVHRHPELHPERYQQRFHDLPSRVGRAF